MNAEIRRFDPGKKHRKATETEDIEECCYYKAGERLLWWKHLTRTTQVEEEQAPRSQPGTKSLVAVVCGAFLVFLLVALKFIDKMGPDPQASASAMAKVIAALGSALGSGIIGLAFHSWRRRGK